MELSDLGWNDHFSREFDKYKGDGFRPARVVREHKERYQVITDSGEFTAEITGKMRHLAVSRLDYPAVGDWVAITAFPEQGSAIIHALLPRKSQFVRKAAGIKTDEQVVAANIDILFIVMGLDLDFNPRRLERYLTSAWDSGARPVILLNKSDLCEDLEEKLAAIESSAVGIDCLPVSATNKNGIEQVRSLIKSGETAAFVGSSGVGKSTIINALLGEERLLTQQIRASDGRGRHTTTWRELIMLPDGGIVIDNPGIRQLKLWTEGDSLEGSFEDIEQLSRECRFGDCTHVTEPGCAILEAIENGTLDPGRYRNYLKMRKELEYLDQRRDGVARMNKEAKWKAIHQRMRKFMEYRRKNGIKT